MYVAPCTHVGVGHRATCTVGHACYIRCHVCHVVRRGWFIIHPSMLRRAPCMLHRVPCMLQRVSCMLHRAPLRRALCIFAPMFPPCILHDAPYKLHPVPYMLHHAPCKLHRASSMMHCAPYMLHCHPSTLRRGLVIDVTRRYRGTTVAVYWQYMPPQGYLLELS